MAKIIVVEDEALLRTALARYLQKKGHEVRMASNGKEALTALRDDPADLVITDINMPDMDGIELINVLRRGAGGPPVIAMSGGGLMQKEMLLHLAGKLGAVVTVEKPFDLTEIHDTIEELLAEPAN